MTLECRLQQVTEDKDIAQRELEVNNCWLDNQKQLEEDLKMANELNAKLEQQNRTLMEVNQIRQKYQGKQKIHPVAAKAPPKSEKMPVTQGMVKELWGECSNKQAEADSKP